MKNSFTIEQIKNSPCGRLNPHLFAEKEKHKRSKYNNVKVELDGYVFDSKAEARHYIELRRRMILGEIKDLKLQEVFQLSVCKYIADFTYLENDGSYVVCDVKGHKTQTYLMKKKLMKSEKNIDILEVK